MTCTFSAQGVRWTVWAIAPGVNDAVRSAHAIAADTALYFKSSDGEERLLALPPEELAALGDLSTHSNQDLATRVVRARPMR